MASPAATVTRTAFDRALLNRRIADGVANGPEQIRAAVRYQIKYGADVIKTCATGGVLSEGDAVGATQYSFEELKALVDEANKLERKVAAHAHGTEGIKLAVRAGVSSIEHGSFLDEEGARMMKERGTFLVPTLSAGEAVEKAAKNGVLKGLRAEKALAAAAAMRHAIKLAVANKVQIALGTDAGVIPHGTNAHEFVLMVGWGRHEQHGFNQRRHAERREAAGLGQEPRLPDRRANGPTSSPSQAIRSKTFTTCRRSCS